MKLESKRKDIIQGGILDKKDFSIKAGAHIMTVLSSLYTNPIEAMVREYLTNMADAYVALLRKNPSAKILPALIHLPSSLDATLIFQDYGIGMDIQTVWDVYTQYGNSTKNDDNLETGGFGLGSKTAFAYNNGSSWTIESRYQGKKHTFIAVVGTNNIPSLNHVSSIDTEEHNGVTIKIPIKRGDFNQVYESAKKYLPFFPYEIIKNGGGDIDIIKPDYLIKNKEWALYKPEVKPIGAYHYPAQKISNILMGNVPYPIKWDQLALHDFSDYTQQEFLYYNKFDFFVEVGSINIVPSRDDIQYTDRTKEKLKKLIKIMLDGIQVYVSNQIACKNTLYDALIYYNELDYLSHGKNIIKNITYRGKTINLINGIIKNSEDLIKLDKDIKIKVLGTQRGGDLVSNSTKIEDLVSYSGVQIKEQDHKELILRINNKTFVIVDDLPKKGEKIIKLYLQDKLLAKTSSGRVAKHDHSLGHAIILTNTTLTSQELSDFFEGWPNILYTSSLKDLVDLNKKTHSYKDTIYKWNGQSWNARVFIPKQDNPTDIFYYVPLTQNTNTSRWEHKHINNIIDISKEFIPSFQKDLYNNIKIYGIKKDEIVQFDDKIWINLEELLKETVIKELPKYTSYSAYDAANKSILESTKVLKKIIDHCFINQNNPDIKFEQFSTIINNIQEYIKKSDQNSIAKLQLINRLADNDNILHDKLLESIKNQKVNESWKELEQYILTTYPIIKLLVSVIMNNTRNSYYDPPNYPSTINQFNLNHPKLLLAKSV